MQGRQEHRQERRSSNRDVSDGSQRSGILNAGSSEGSTSTEVGLRGRRVIEAHRSDTQRIDGSVLKPADGTPVDDPRSSRGAIRPKPGPDGQFVDLDQLLRDVQPDKGVPGWPEESGVKLVGKSPIMQALFKQAAHAATKTAPLLLLGEPGTGKYSLARAIHAFSPRSKGPFIAENLGAFGEKELERRLFGEADRKGRWGFQDGPPTFIDHAWQGTLYLSMLESLPLRFQERLCDALRELNGIVHIILSTASRDLGMLARGNRFFPALWQLLESNQIEMPKLDARKEDIPLLVHVLLNSLARQLGVKVRRASQDAVQRLSEMDWPGNVLGLESACRQALLRGKHAELSFADFVSEARG